MGEGKVDLRPGCELKRYTRLFEAETKEGAVMQAYALGKKLDGDLPHYECRRALTNATMREVHSYGESVFDFGPGDRVALHPATDAFMRGERYGTAFKSQHQTLTLVRIELDGGRIARFAPMLLRLL